MPHELSRILYRSAEGLVIGQYDQEYAVGREDQGKDGYNRIRQATYHGKLVWAVNALAKALGGRSEANTLREWSEAHTHALVEARERLWRLGPPAKDFLCGSRAGLVISAHQEYFVVGRPQQDKRGYRKVHDATYHPTLIQAVEWLAERSARSSETQGLYQWLRVWQGVLTEAVEWLTAHCAAKPEEVNEAKASSISLPV